ncbi:MAG: RtcB family protein, partial [Anaerolineae bacterium]|nr:RtcB family protein [Anaerolineae bacterium]
MDTSHISTDLFGELRPQPLPYAVYGENFIDAKSRHQMDSAMRLPVTVAGALMPDAHVGYGLPIGGGLAPRNAVFPHAPGGGLARRKRAGLFPPKAIT